MCCIINVPKFKVKMHILFGGRNGRMPEHFLERTQIHTPSQKVRRERMAKNMGIAWTP